MRSRRWLEIATLGSSSWMPYAPQGVKGTDDDLLASAEYSKHILYMIYFPISFRNVMCYVVLLLHYLYL
jgi:hypothetical protein